MAVKQLGPAASGASDAVRKSELDLTAGPTTVVLTADVINNNATLNTLQDVTGLSFPVASGSRYWFRFVIPYTSAAVTTGSRWTINGPTFSALYYESRYTASSNAQTINYQAAYNTPAASNAASLTTGNMAFMEGFIIPSAAGSVIARFASEIASSAITAKAGGFVQYRIV